jgi:hypothetical protein
MTTRKGRQRTARKLVLPLIAVAMMATMMFMESASRRAHESSISPAPRRAPAAARAAHDLRQR